MHVNVIILVTTITVTGVRGSSDVGQPDNASTRTPVVAPDSESVISVEGRLFPTIHHSDIHLGQISGSNNSKTPQVTAMPKGDAEVHHSDIYMTKTDKKAEFVHDSTRSQIRTTTLAYILNVETKSDESEQNGGGSGNTNSKTIVAHPPLISDSKPSSEKAFEDDHGPVSKRGEDKSHVQEPDHDRRVINHAPLATERHPPKAVGAHHPSLSKHWDSMTGAHAPIAFTHHSNHTIEHSHKHKLAHEHANSTNLQSSHPDKHSTVQHAPMAREHHGSKPTFAHHPSLSKNDNLSPNGTHPEPSNPIVHSSDPALNETSHASPTPPDTASDAHQVHTTAHHPSLSKGDLVSTREIVNQ